MPPPAHPPRATARSRSPTSRSPPTSGLHSRSTPPLLPLASTLVSSSPWSSPPSPSRASPHPRLPTGRKPHPHRQICRPAAAPSPSAPLWASLSLADGAAPGSVELCTGAAFPAETAGGRRLLGVGLRRTTILGLKSIDVYAFGVYADDHDLRQLREKYQKLPVSELKENSEMIDDALERDIRMTVRLQIVYARLSIRSVRSAFEKSVRSRLQKFGGSDTNELLQSFVSFFKDEY